MPESIQERFMAVEKRIDNACLNAGRNRQDVRLIVVTKGHSEKEIIEVVNAGATLLGENYPEETTRKMEELGKLINPTWHMIGHLQSRKIKLMYPAFSCIHSVDSLELAQKVSRFYEGKDSKIDVLLEVNIAGEDSKFGFDATTFQARDRLLSTIETISHLSCIRLKGLMTMPPYAVEPSQNEACYNLCRDYCNKISNDLGLKEFQQLSMGTSSDFEAAIKCGATYIRVGEAIMGKRIYQNK